MCAAVKMIVKEEGLSHVKIDMDFLGSAFEEANTDHDSAINFDEFVEW